VGGSERVTSYCTEEHGGRGVYLNKGGIEYSYFVSTRVICAKPFDHTDHGYFQHVVSTYLVAMNLVPNHIDSSLLFECLTDDNSCILKYLKEMVGILLATRRSS
jgi:hypothetical protein